MPKPRKTSTTDLSPEALRQAINGRFGEGTMLMASDPSFEVQRLSTGILALDWFLNGGFARGRHTEIYGSPNVGKCIEANEIIPLANGSMVPAKDLVGKTFDVICWDETTGAQSVSRAWAEDNGVENVWEVVTTTGRKISRTSNHPLWTLRDEAGWVTTSNLTSGDKVLVPIHHLAEGTMRVPDEWCEAAGFLIGDGGMTQPNTTFTQLDGPQLDRFTDVMQSMGCKVLPTSDPITYRVTGGDPDDKNKILRLTRGWDIRGHSRDKHLPAFIWTAPNDQLALLLNRYFACDGWACLSSGEPRQRNGGMIGCASASERLIREISSALLRFGVWGYITSKVTNGVRYWTWQTRNPVAIDNFANRIGILGKEEAVQASVMAANAIKKKVSDTGFWSPPSGYRWEKIRSVTKQSSRPTVAIEVDRHPTFVTDFVEHNTYTALKFIATSQAAGLRCAFVNVERSFDKEFARRIGVDLKKLELIKHRNANQAIDIAELILRCEEYDVIVLDSIAALVPESELDADMSQSSMGMEQAKLMSKALRKLTTAIDKTAFVWINQVRENVGGAQWGKKTRTSGGMAMSFYASTRIEMVKTETIKSPSKMITPSSGKVAAKDLPRGHRVLARIDKEKAGARPYAETTFVFDNRKVRHDPFEDLMYIGRQMDLVKLKGDTWWIAGKMNAPKFHGRPKFRAHLAANPKVCARLEKKIRERIGKDIFEDA